MSSKRISYPPEYRQQIVELYRAGRKFSELAREFEPSEQTIRTWVKQTDLDAGRRTDGVTTQERLAGDLRHGTHGSCALS